ncbi:MAG: hypothetical protein C4329_13320 [Chitinophagaceae bacterium]
MEEKQLSEQESLLLIQQMINTAKKEQVDDGKRWIVWGWMLCSASLFTVLNVQFHWFQNMFLFWNAFGVVSLAWFAYRIYLFLFKKTTSRVKTYTGDLFSRLNGGFFISLIFIIISINIGGTVLDSIVPVNIGFALLINLYAFWILIYGAALNFKPSVIGAYVAWAFGLVALFANQFTYVMLLHAAAVLCGYIIPGHLANRKFKELHSKGEHLRV